MLYCRLGVVHRDIKPENFLLGAPTLLSAPAGTAASVLKISDFGVSAFFEPGNVSTEVLYAQQLWLLHVRPSRTSGLPLVVIRRLWLPGTSYLPDVRICLMQGQADARTCLVQRCCLMQAY